jgi:hypothetical protein
MGESGMNKNFARGKTDNGGNRCREHSSGVNELE